MHFIFVFRFHSVVPLKETFNKYFLTIIMGLILPYIYIFISLNSPTYPIKWVLHPVYRQSIVNISLSKNILLLMRGKNRKGTVIFCLYSFHLMASCFCFYRHFLFQSSYSLSFKPYLYSLLLTCSSLLTPWYLLSSSEIF